MQKKLTITIDEKVYEGLYAVIGRRRISLSWPNSTFVPRLTLSWRMPSVLAVLLILVWLILILAQARSFPEYDEANHQIGDHCHQDNEHDKEPIHILVLTTYLIRAGLAGETWLFC